MTPIDKYGIDDLIIGFYILPAIWSGKINNDRKSIETYIDKKYINDRNWIKVVPSETYKSDIDEFLMEYSKFLKKDLPLKYKIFCLYKLDYNHNKTFYMICNRKPSFREFKKDLLSKFSKKNYYHKYQKILIESGEDFSIFKNKKED